MASTLKVNTIQNAAGNLNFFDGAPSFDLWRLSANFSGNDATITGWEQPDSPTTSVGATINGMSETSSNSGVFLFPSTGIYQVTLFLNGVQSSNADSSMGASIHTSHDSGSSFPMAALVYGNGDTDTGHNNGAATSCFVKVTNTSTTQLKFITQSLGTGAFLGGNSTYNFTHFTSVKMAPLQ